MKKLHEMRVAFVRGWRRFWLLDEADAAFPETFNAEAAQNEPPPDAVQADWVSPLDLPYVSSRVCWRAIRHGGGGVFATPPLEERDALRYILDGARRKIIAVDRKNYFIFYADAH